MIQNLRTEYARLSAEANPWLLTWDEFKSTALMIGINKLHELPAEEALEKLESLERPEA